MLIIKHGNLLIMTNNTSKEGENILIKDGRIEAIGPNLSCPEGTEIIGIDNRVGRLETGKDADIIICSGDILSLDSSIEHVFISGNKVTE
ncbi:MAG: amidohydrolase family protein [Bacillota bacterium]